MTKTRRPIELDFTQRTKRNRYGLALLAIGVVGLVGVMSDYRDIAGQAEEIDWRLANVRGSTKVRAPDAATLRADQEATQAVADLRTPWSALLEELERAGADSDGSIALLDVEPDREKHEVRILAEAPTLNAALAYVRRLQESQALRYPMLESHEIRQKDPQRPVRFQIRADWRGAS
jgi:hypothetical protein